MLEGKPLDMCARESSRRPPLTPIYGRQYSLAWSPALKTGEKELSTSIHSLSLPDMNAMWPASSSSCCGLMDNALELGVKRSPFSLQLLVSGCFLTAATLMSPASPSFSNSFPFPIILGFQTVDTTTGEILNSALPQARKHLPVSLQSHKRQPVTSVSDSQEMWEKIKRRL